MRSEGSTDLENKARRRTRETSPEMTVGRPQCLCPVWAIIGQISSIV